VDRIPDCQQWAQEHFGTAKLGDPRRAKRLVASAAAIAAHPEKSFPSIFDWNELRAFYNLCGRDEATLQALQQPHWELTRRAMAREPLVLIVHDTTELDFTSHHALQGAGPIGDHRGRGFLQHNSLAFSPDGSRLLGLAYQQLKVRQPTPPKETRKARKKRARESQMWTEGIQASGRPPEGSAWVDVGDRGADIYEAMEEAFAIGHHFLFRACQNRVVFKGEAAGAAGEEQEVYLMEHARALAPQGDDAVEVPPGPGRPGRTAAVKLAACAVRVPPPRTAAGRRQRPTLAAWVVRVWEPEPPEGVKPLEWVLLCSVRTETVEQIKEKRGWYAVRWGAEVYHDVEKNGCSEEGRRFESAEAMASCLAVLAVVAVRVYQLRLAVKAMPDAPAQEVATAEEIAVMQEHLGKKSLSVLQFVRGVAKLGGFLGRKGDGEPGIRSLWRGYQRLQDMVAGFRLLSKRRHASP
jgi:Transposase DNA-binding/Transposase Tn5 dimerisation domain